MVRSTGYNFRLLGIKRIFLDSDFHEFAFVILSLEWVDKKGKDRFNDLLGVRYAKHGDTHELILSFFFLYPVTYVWQPKE